MDETVLASEANRAFSLLLRGVRAGRSYLVTAHGRPAARLVPAGEGDQQGREVRVAARRVLIERVLEQRAVDVGHWSRDALYQR